MLFMGIEIIAVNTARSPRKFDGSYVGYCMIMRGYRACLHEVDKLDMFSRRTLFQNTVCAIELVDKNLCIVICVAAHHGTDHAIHM